MQRQLDIIEPQSELDRLRETSGIALPNIESARLSSQAFRENLEEGLFGMTSEDASVVVFGSLARDEFTGGSDVDWTLLIDGEADPKHIDLAQQVRKLVTSLAVKQPGREAVFGNIAFSHEIIHRIGGEDDTNSNTTKRILLLLESRPIGRRGAFDRVLNHVLIRYIDEDTRFLSADAKFQVPRFLLNDFARYWRTMAVDFAYKRRTRGGKGAAIRNLKLRMSRKLIFVSGLLACFSYHLLLPEGERRQMLRSLAARHDFVRHLRRVLDQTPLEILAAVINQNAHLRDTGAQLFQAYDEFLGALGDQTKRASLDALRPGDEDGDPLFQELRKCSHRFRDALLTLFFDEATGLAQMTRTYGVF
jgi:predicted nucleotidyltransferase